jgi:hypothetical protein
MKAPWKALQGMREQRLRADEVGNRLARTVTEAAQGYNELAPDGRELSAADASRARELLVAVARSLREIHEDDELIRTVAEDGQRRGRDTDLRPTISLIRMIQRGLVLALSEDPTRRKQAMPLNEMAEFAVPVTTFWRNL